MCSIIFYIFLFQNFVKKKINLIYITFYKLDIKFFLRRKKKKKVNNIEFRWTSNQKLI